MFATAASSSWNDIDTGAQRHHHLPAPAATHHYPPPMMDNSIGGAAAAAAEAAGNLFASAASDLAASVAAAGIGEADDSPTTLYTTFEAEFWRSFAEDHQLFEAPQQLPFDAAESSGLFSGHFLPPPPRPPFMDVETVLTDGLTTCDLCSWAVQEKNAFSLEGSFEAAGELGWAFSIGLVSVVSALIGAIIMITLVRCRRLKSNSAQHMNAHHLHRHNGAHHHRHHLHHHHHDHLDHERSLGLGFGAQHLHHHHPGLHHHSIHAGTDGLIARGAGDIVGGPDCLGIGDMGGFAGNSNGNGDHGGDSGGGGGGGGGFFPWWKPSDGRLASEHHTLPKQRPPESLPTAAANPQVWIWLKTVNTPPTPEPIPMFPPSASIENYYTNTDDGIAMHGGNSGGGGKVTEVVYEEIAGIG